MDRKHLLAHITGTVDQELLVRNEYLVTENRILRHQIPGRVRLSDSERATLDLLSAPLTIPLVYCHINSFRRASGCGEAMARRRK
jgi:hypothetical protein